MLCTDPLEILIRSKYECFLHKYYNKKSTSLYSLIHTPQRNFQKEMNDTLLHVIPKRLANQDYLHWLGFLILGLKYDHQVFLVDGNHQKSLLSR